MTWWNRPKLKEHDAIICDGAIRSGKTLSMAVGFVLWSMHCFSGQSFAFCGKTLGSVRRNLVEPLARWLGPWVAVREKADRNLLIITDQLGRSNSYYLFGGDHEGSRKKIQGITLAGILLDEVALMPRSFVEQACGRCSVEGSRLWFNCNPEGPEHWFYKEWIRKAQRKNALWLHFTMEDNPSLSPKVRRRYEAQYTGLFYQRYILGQWAAAEGLIYAFDPQRHIARELPGQGRYYISVDYGTRNPFSAGLWCVTEGKAVRLREYYYCGREEQSMRTDEQYHGALEALAGELPVERVIIDPSAASMIATIRHHGRFSVRKARNQVLSGIQTVARLLQEGRLQIGPACKDTIREFGLYRWEDGPVRDVPRKENDHAMDDIRYFCATVMARERKER